MKNPKVSIVIPVYNAEKYLEKCVLSAVNQTYDNYEILIINDGSQDKSQEIMERLAMKYPEKVRIFNQKNIGVAETRNRGIDYSTGEYLFFMDNDDYIDSDYIEQFTKKAIEIDADMVIGGHKQIENFGENIKIRTLTNDTWSKYRFLTPWARVYKKQFLIDNNIHFLNTKMGEEIYCSVLAATYSKNVAIIDYCGYNWIVNNVSVSHTLQKGFQKEASPVKLLNSIYQTINMEELDTEKKEQLEYFYVKYCIWYMLDSGKGVGIKKMKEEYQEIFDLLILYFPQYKRNNLIRLSKPKGETFFTRVVVWGLVNLSKVKLDRLIFLLYSIV